MKMPNVYIPNNSGHDFSQAKNFGELIFITDGVVDRFQINNMYRKVVEALEESKDNDYIMVTGLTQISVVLASVFAFKHGRLNLLLFDIKRGEYLSREIVLENLIEKEQT